MALLIHYSYFCSNWGSGSYRGFKIWIHISILGVLSTGTASGLLAFGKVLNDGKNGASKHGRARDTRKQGIKKRGKEY